MIFQVNNFRGHCRLMQQHFFRKTIFFLKASTCTFIQHRWGTTSVLDNSFRSTTLHSNIRTRQQLRKKVKGNVMYRLQFQTLAQKFATIQKNSISGINKSSFSLHSGYTLPPLPPIYRRTVKKLFYGAEMNKYVTIICTAHAISY